MTSFGSGYLLKGVGKGIQKLSYLTTTPLWSSPFPEPDSTPRSELKHSYSNTSQYLSFSLTFDEINQIIKENYKSAGANGMGAVPKYNLIK